MPVGVVLMFQSDSHWNVWNKTSVPKTTEEMVATGIKEVRPTSNLVVPTMMQILMLMLCAVHVVEAKTDQLVIESVTVIEEPVLNDGWTQEFQIESSISPRNQVQRNDAFGA